jgi:hypothetical protein
LKRRGGNIQVRGSEERVRERRLKDDQKKFSRLSLKGKHPGLCLAWRLLPWM